MRFRSLAALTIAACLVHTAAAQDWIFLGNPGDWDADANWDQGVVPNNTSNVLLGHDATIATAVANINDAAFNATVADIRVGAGNSFGGANGTLNQTAGTLNSNSGAWAFLGADGPAGMAGNTGTYNLSGTGVFNNDAQMHIGIGGGAGATNQGLLDVSGTATMNLNEFYVGSNDGNTGMVDQSGGTINATTMYVGDATFGVAGHGVYDQTGGDIVVQDWLSIGRQASATGTYNMSGGSLTIVNDFLTVGEVGAGTSGTMNVSGAASISAANIGVGRFGETSTGTLRVVEDDATIGTGTLLVGVNDQDSFNPADSTGTLRFESSTASVSTISVTGDVHLNDGSTVGAALLEVDLTGAPTSGDITLITYGGTLSGTFMGLPEGVVVPNSGNRTISYMGGQVRLLADGGMVVNGDFNGDMMWDCADINALVAAIASGSTDLSFDMNGDMVIDANDVLDPVNGWLTVGGANNPAATGGNPFLSGDATLDGNVNGQDFIVWNNNKFTNTAAWCSGDFTVDGVINGQDFIEWNNNKFMSSDGFAAVPEPAVNGVLLLVIAYLSRHWIRTRC